MFAAESAHVVYDQDLACPVTHAVTAAKVNDIIAAKETPIAAGAASVFDLGYYLVHNIPYTRGHEERSDESRTASNGGKIS